MKELTSILGRSTASTRPMHFLWVLVFYYCFSSNLQPMKNVIHMSWYKVGFTKQCLRMKAFIFAIWLFLYFSPFFFLPFLNAFLSSVAMPSTFTIILLACIFLEKIFSF